jgi:hypothetical protein
MQCSKEQGKLGKTLEQRTNPPFGGGTPRSTSPSPLLRGLTIISADHPRLDKRVRDRRKAGAEDPHLTRMSNFIKGAAALKTKELPAYVQKYAGEHLAPPVVQSRFTAWLNNYKKQVRSMAAGAANGVVFRTDGAASVLHPLRHTGLKIDCLRLRPQLASPQHIDTGSSKPFFDVVIYGFIGAYALAWPQEYAHYKHEQEMKLKGGKH